MYALFLVIGVLAVIFTPIALLWGVTGLALKAQHPGRWSRWWKLSAVSAIAAVVCISIGMTIEPAEQKMADAKRASESQAQEAAAAVVAGNQAKASEARNLTSQRQAAQDYWATVMAKMSTAYFALNNPQALGATDLTDLMVIVKKAGQFAEEAKMAAVGGEKPRPAGWEDVERDLGWSAKKLSDGCTSLQKFIDDQKTSDKVDAMEASVASRQAIWDAIGKARTHYVKMGGKADQLRDYGVPAP